MHFGITVSDPEKFDSLLLTIHNTVKFDCSQYSRSFLGRRVEVRLRVCNLDSYAAYEEVLRTNSAEREHLRKELTIHTTNFFRDKDMWTVFQKETLPMLRKVKEDAGSKALKVWSAGCSTGEEPLTIAITLYEYFGEDLSGYRVSILASDLDKNTVALAKEGVYELNQFREMPLLLREKYFVQEGQLLKASEKLLRLITYEVRDIHGPKPKDLDIIFCRNTVIYFDQEWKKRIYVDFFVSLKVGGFFVMGKTETLLGPARDSFQIMDLKERIYFKDE